MTENTNEPAAQAAESNAEGITAQPAAKTRRPRRMARDNEPAKSPRAKAGDGPLSKLAAPRGDSKISQVIALLSREEGATLAELVEATGWQPHTTRAALTGLRKKGRTLNKSKRGEVTCYKLGEGA